MPETRDIRDYTINRFMFVSGFMKYYDGLTNEQKKKFNDIILDSVVKADYLTQILDGQAKLMEVVENRNGTTGSLSENIMAAMVELGELANEDGSFKWWKKEHKKNIDKVLEEYVDVLHFMFQFAIKCGFTANDIFNAYMNKLEKNIERQNDNY